MGLSLTVNAYLNLRGIQVDRTFLNKLLFSHPDHPSLVSVTDTFDFLGLTYKAGRVEKAKYPDLQYPLIAHTRSDGQQDFEIISSKSEFEVANRELLEKWDGVYLYLDSDASVHNAEHKSYLIENRITRAKNRRILLPFSVLFVYIVFLNFNAITLSLTVLSLIGLFICQSIYLHSTGKSNRIAKHLCSTHAGQDCNKVLSSTIGRIGNITLGDVGIIYFGTSIAFLLLSLLTGNIDQALLVFSISGFCSILFTFFSLWYQWRILKSWCKLCLLVIAVLWLQSAILFGTQTISAKIQAIVIEYKIIWLLVVLYGILLFLSGSIWLAFKYILTIPDREARKDLELMQIKRNPDVFKSLLLKQKQVDSEVWPEDIVLGNKDAQLKILVVCNPYCGPCKKAHQHLSELLNTYGDLLKIVIRFAVHAEDKMDIRTIATSRILNAYHNLATSEHRKHIVDEWFAMMDIQAFDRKYPGAIENGIDKLLIKHEQWYQFYNISETPTIFVNSFQLPPKFSGLDLQLLAPLLYEDITELIVTRETNDYVITS